MPSLWKRIGSVVLAVGVLSALMINAGMSAGGCSKAEPEAVDVVKEPLRAGPNVPGAAEPRASPNAPNPAAGDNGALDDESEEGFMGASKSGAVYRRPKAAAAASAPAASTRPER